MPQLEQLHKTKHSRPVEAASTFPEEYLSRRVNGGSDGDGEDVLVEIEQVLAEHDKVLHTLGHLSIEA